MNKKLFAKLFAIVLCVCVLCSLAIVFSSAATESGTWTLVTDAGTLKAGDTIVIVAKDSNVAMSTTQNNNNRGQAAVTKSSDKNTLTALNDAVQRITLEAGKSTGTFAFKTDAGYLYAASSGSNHLKSEKTLSNNSSWKITISNGTATVIAQGSNTRNNMKYNSQSSIFSCYSSGQKDIAIYRLETAGADACEHVWDDGVVTTPAKCTVDGQMTYTCTLCDETKTGVITAPGHTGGTATCEELAECSVCGNPYGEYAPHTYEDGYCTVCDAKQPAAVFDFGNKGGAAADGTEIKAAKSYTDGEYTLTITPVSKVYGSAYDAKGNSVLKFGTGDVAGSMNITVPNDVTSVVIYVAGYKANAATVTINGTAHTVVGRSNDGVYDAIEIDTTANKTISFAVTSGYRAMVDTIEFYVSESDAPVCEHENTSPVVDEATCYTAGSSKVVCDDCSVVISVQTLPAAHTYANGVCSVCNVVEAPVTGVPYKFGMYQGNLGTTHYIVGGMDGYYMATGTDAAAGLNVYLEETEGGYYLYTFVSGIKTYVNMVVNDGHVNGAYETTASTVYTYNTEKKLLTASVNGETYAFGTRSDKTFDTVGPVKTTNGNFYCEFYAAGDVDRITSAGVVLGTTLGMNFAVSVPAGVPTMTVEFAGKTYELTAKNLTDTTYQFSFRGIGPHQMAENIKATLLVDGVAVAELNNYTVEKNLKAILALDASLANIVNAVLAYGDAAENYNKIEGGVTAPETETEVEITEENNKLDLDNADDFGFTAAGVNFDSDNKIYVKFYVAGEFKFFVNGEEVAIEKTEDGYYKFYTTALTATQFDDTFTFEIEVNGVKATLVYSVNTYAYSMQNDADMGELAKALYVYGIAAEDYAN